MKSMMLKNSSRLIAFCDFKRQLFMLTKNNGLVAPITRYEYLRHVRLSRIDKISSFIELCMVWHNIDWNVWQRVMWAYIEKKKDSIPYTACKKKIHRNANYIAYAVCTATEKRFPKRHKFYLKTFNQKISILFAQNAFKRAPHIPIHS